MGWHLSFSTDDGSFFMMRGAIGVMFSSEADLKRETERKCEFAERQTRDGTHPEPPKASIATRQTPNTAPAIICFFLLGIVAQPDEVATNAEGICKRRFSRTKRMSGPHPFKWCSADYRALTSIEKPSPKSRVGTCVPSFDNDSLKSSSSSTESEYW